MPESTNEAQERLDSRRLRPVGEGEVWRIVLSEFPDSQPLWTEDPEVADSFRASKETTYTVRRYVPEPQQEEAAVVELDGKVVGRAAPAASPGQWLALVEPEFGQVGGYFCSSDAARLAVARHVGLCNALTVPDDLLLQEDVNQAIGRLRKAGDPDTASEAAHDLAVAIVAALRPQQEEDGGAARDFEYELHMEQCAHGGSLFRVEGLAADLEREAADLEEQRKREAESAPGTTGGFVLRARAETLAGAAKRLRELCAELPATGQEEDGVGGADGRCEFCGSELHDGDPEGQPILFCANRSCPKRLSERLFEIAAATRKWGEDLRKGEEETIPTDPRRLSEAMVRNGDFFSDMADLHLAGHALATPSPLAAALGRIRAAAESDADLAKLPALRNFLLEETAPATSPPVLSELPPRKFEKGQKFKGTAFGQPVTVTLDSPEWFEPDDAEPFWTWHCTTHLGGGATLAESELAEHWKPVEATTPEKAITPLEQAHEALRDAVAKCAAAKIDPHYINQVVAESLGLQRSGLTILWAQMRDEGYPPQFVAAFSEGEVDAWHDQHLSRRAEAEDWFRNWGDDPTEIVGFFTTSTDVFRPEPRGR